MLLDNTEYKRSIVLKKLKRYWPTRVEDFQNKLLDIDVIPLITKSQREYLKELKQTSSITDPDNNLIVGFEIGILFIEVEELDMTINQERLNQEIANLKKEGRLSTKGISDTYHTFGDLYDHRMAFNVALTRAIDLFKRDDSFDLQTYKSLKHHDGTMFEGMFIVVIESPIGQISYHYNLEHWDKFKIDVLEKSLPYDGHTPADTIDRLLRLL